MHVDFSDYATQSRAARPILDSLADALREHSFADAATIDIEGGDVYVRCSPKKVGVLAPLTTFTVADIPLFIDALAMLHTRPKT